MGSVVKLHVCYGESRLFLPFNIGCHRFHALIQTHTRMYHRAFRPILHGIPCVAFPQISWAPFGGTWTSFQVVPRHPPLLRPCPWPILLSRQKILPFSFVQ